MYKDGRLPCARKYGNAIASFETKRKTPNKFWSKHDTEAVSMTSLSRRLEPWTH